MLNHQFLGFNKYTNHNAGQRLKRGFQNWKNKDYSYEGTFLRNSLHGYGTLKNDNLWTYEGNFYSNLREGYAVLSLANNSYFEGLFIQNQPFGPGILTYSNGRQDVGFWVGRKLVRLSRPVDFIVPRLAATLSAKMKLLLLQNLIPLREKNFDSVTEIFDMAYKKDLLFHLYSNNVYDQRSLFFDSSSFEKSYFMTLTESYEDIRKSLRSSENEFANDKYDSTVDISHRFCKNGLSDKYNNEKFNGSDICNNFKIFTSEEYELGILNSLYKKLGKLDVVSDHSTSEYSGIDCEDKVNNKMEEKAENSEFIPPQMIFWNRGALCTEMLKLIFRYRAFEDKLNFKIAELMTGIRTAFRNTGEKERICLKFLKMCSTGPPHAVKNLLCDSEISEELMDSRGNNSIMFAVASDQREIVDILLDYGVNVNSFNDENLTPLNLCLLRRLAQANGIYSWETAFLPPVLNKTLEDHQKFSNFKMKDSIESLDRVVGDGTSNSNISEKNIDIIESVSSTKHSEKKEGKLSSFIDATRDLQSQITILNFKPSFESGIQEKDLSIECTSAVFDSQEPTLNTKQKISPNSNTKEEFEKSVSKTNNDKYLFQIFSGEYFEDKNECEKKKINENISEEIVDEKTDSNLIKRLLEIDKTIEKLLQRGADPNISEIPRPSIHLAIFTKNVNLVELFLRYGANPNSQLYFNEGLLTPLHVLVLIKPSPEYIDICELLLSFGANPEEETAPNFSMWEGEKSFLNEFHGRTPLQLLCMRPDLEQGDPNGYIIKIGLLLAKVSNKKHFFNGHSCLTLAMLTGNVRLFKNLLQSGSFDPNQKLGKGLGTALQVLLSTNYQQNSNNGSRVNMCNLLISAGANVLPKFSIPSSLRSSTVKFARLSAAKERKFYLTSALQRNGKSNLKSKIDSSRKSLKDSMNIIATTRRLKDQAQVDLNVSEKNVISKDTKLKKAKQKFNNYAKKKEEKVASKISIQVSSSIQNRKNAISKENTIFTNEIIKQEYKIKSADGNHKKSPLNEKSKSRKNAININTSINNVTSKNTSKGFGEKDIKKKKFLPFDVITEADKRKKPKEKKFLKKRPRKFLNKPKEIYQNETEQGKGKKTFEKRIEKQFSELDTQKGKLLKNKAKRMYPNALRNSLINLFGNHVNIDVNQFFLPYVVLRDGNLYYRFKSQPGIEKEQYSLI